MNPALIAAWCSGPGLLVLDRLITWARNRHKDDAEAGLTIDQRWQGLADDLREDMKRLRDRVTALETDLKREREQKDALAAEVDRYKAIARSLLRHVLRLREELGKKGGGVLPDLPPDVEDAMTSINLP